MELLIPIHDPSKHPTLEDLESLKPHPCLVQALEALWPSIVLIDPKLHADSNSDSDSDEVAFQLEQVVDVVDIVHNDSDDDESEGPYLSESEESNDSIAKNADFISLY
jgi:hypothetical protein